MQILRVCRVAGPSRLLSLRYMFRLQQQISKNRWMELHSILSPLTSVGLSQCLPAF